MTDRDREALNKIAEIMPAPSWTPDTLDDVARVLISAGYATAEDFSVDTDVKP